MNLGTAYLGTTNFSFLSHRKKEKNNISKSLSKPSPSLVKLINKLNNFTDKTKRL